MRRGVAALAAVTVVGSGLVGALVSAPEAEARYATGGTGAYLGAIDWFEWGTHGQAIPADGVEMTNTRTVAGEDITITCTLGPQTLEAGSPTGGLLTAYKPGSWREDGLDEMYNIGGAGLDNQLVAGLSTASNGLTVSFDFDCSAALDGEDIPLAGLVMADAEASYAPQGEYVQATIDEGQWRLIDRYRSPGCEQSTPITLNDGTLRLAGNGDPRCATFSTAVTFMEGATSAEVEVKGGGVSAIALGVMLAGDFGDAPESYGEAGALYSTSFSGGEIPEGSSTAFELDLATPEQPLLRLGETIDSEAGHQPSPGADADGADEDAVDPIGTVTVTPGGSYTLPDVTCYGEGTVAGWVDWNNNGTFDEGERSSSADCAGGSVDLVWEVPADVVAGDSFVRLRIGANADAVASPTGMTTSGEVEDHALTVAFPTLDITKTSDATADTRVGDVVSYTVTATNNTDADFTAAYPAIIRDDLTGVLDDATFGEDAAVTPEGGELLDEAPVLGWSGPLAAGESVALSYSVTLTAGGDRVVENVAWAPVPGDEDEPTPECVDGQQGVPCAVTSLELPRLTIAKTADRASLPALGEELTFEVTVTNTGSVDYTEAAPATFSDDLSDVLDDATYVPGSLTSTLGEAELDGTTITWSGALPAGESAVVSYTVAYTGAGDRVLDNVACVPAAEAVDAAARCATVSVPGSGLQQTKTVDPASGAVVEAGDTLTYTLTFTNVGGAAATVDTVDDLSGVLDDATLVADPTAGEGLTAAFDDNDATQLLVTGTVPAGESRTVTYTVEVADFDEQGDHVLENALACPLGAPEDCEPQTTENPVRNLAITKVSDADADTRAGDTVTYTVTATNEGAGDYTADAPAVVVDDLTGVLDDASLVGEPTANVDGELDYTEPRLTWTGALGAGDSVTLSYTVTLDSTDAERDGVVENVAWVAEPGTEDGPTPECTDGVDPQTGLACATESFELPALTVTKTADTDTLPAIGETVTYTVTVTNVGPGDYTEAAPATMSDDLTDVLDDTQAAIDIDPVDTGAVSLDGNVLTWTGALAAEQSATIIYTVEYTGAGDHTLDNTACVPASQVAPGSEPCATVTVLGADLVYSKVSDPATGTPVMPGQDVTYTLTFANTGLAPATVDATDDLSDVLDDATVTGAPITTGALEASVEDGELSVTGIVPAGQNATISYTVTVADWDEQGDSVLANVVTDAGGTCAGCATEHPVQHLSLTKTSDAADDVTIGDTVAYTVTVTNDGESAFTEENPASFTDDLAGVLDDARLTGEVSAASGEVTVADGEITWTGPLAVGESATVTYEVTVTSAGDHELVNVADLPAELCADGEDCSVEVTTPLPHVVAAKAADPASGEGLAAGDVVTYTLTFTNEGQATGAVDATDDLSELLDDATVTAEPVSDHEAVTVTRTDELIRVVGDLPAGDVATVTYQVTIGADGERGDNLARNVLTPDVPVVECDEDGECEPVAPPSTEHPIGELADAKTVDPASGATVRPGAEVTYTLTFTNTGEADVAVDRDDVLSDVLDDATLVAAPAASDEALEVSDVVDGRFNVSGTLAAGQTVTVSYVVVVNDDGERGDDRLANFLVDGGEDAPEECVADEDGQADCTVNHVSDVRVVKSADPADGSAVGSGDAVTYTLTFTNVSTNPSAEPVDLDYTDHLAGVLDDADLTAGPESSDAELVTATLSDEAIRVVGTLASGEVATVTYTVEVRDHADQGDHVLVNEVAITGEAVLCADTSGLCTSHPVTPPEAPVEEPTAPGTEEPTAPGTGGSDLPQTGANAGAVIGGALALLLLGTAAVATRRRTTA